MPPARNKYQRLDVWGRAQVVALSEEGYSSTEIAKRVRKPPCGGRLGDHPKPESVRSIVQKARADPKYRGETKAGPGRNPELSVEEQQKLVDLVFEHRGSSVVTVRFCTQSLPCLRRVTRWTVSRALHKAGLAWLRRRCKKWIPDKGKIARLAYARWLLRQAIGLLEKQAFAFCPP